MAKKDPNELANQPRYGIVTINTDVPISEEELYEIIRQQNGVTLCIRSLNGHPHRGGHFFCFSYNESEEIALETMEQVFVDSFSVPDFVRFINHACGLKFDKEMQLYCQNRLNFRDDE